MTDSEKINLVFEKMSIMEKELAELRRDVTCLEITQKKEQNEDMERNMSEHFKVEKNELDIVGLKAEMNVLDIRIGYLESSLQNIKEKLV